MAGAALTMRPAVWALHCLLGRPRDSLLAIVVAGSVGTIAVNALMLQRGPHPAPIFASASHTMPGLSRNDVLIRRNDQFVSPAAAPQTAAPPVQRSTVSEETTGAVAPMLPRARPPEAPPKVTPAATRPAAGRKDPIGDLIGPEHSAAPSPPAPVQAAKATQMVAAPPPVSAAPVTKVAAAPLQAATPQPAAMASPQPSPASAQIASVQRVLSSFGYLQMSPNGTMGPETKRAIEDFERERSMPVTGQISDRLVRELTAVTGKSL